MCARVRSLAPSVEPAGLFVSKAFQRIASHREATEMIDPFTVVAMALGFAMVASFMLATIKQ